MSKKQKHLKRLSRLKAAVVFYYRLVGSPLELSPAATSIIVSAATLLNTTVVYSPEAVAQAKADVRKWTSELEIFDTPVEMGVYYISEALRDGKGFTADQYQHVVDLRLFWVQDAEQQDEADLEARRLCKAYKKALKKSQK